MTNVVYPRILAEIGQVKMHFCFHDKCRLS